MVVEESEGIWYALNECAEGVGGSVGIIKCKGYGILLIHPITILHDHLSKEHYLTVKQHWVFSR